MPDNKCRMCYECDSRFTVFNRWHHCRSCGRLFCSKCMQNGEDDGERVKFCKFCFQAIGKEAMAEEYDSRSDVPALTQLFRSSDDKLGSCRSFRSERLTGFLEAQQGFSLPYVGASSSTTSSVEPLSPVSLHCSVIRNDEEDTEDTGKQFLSLSSELCQDISDVDVNNTNTREGFYNCKSLVSSSFGSPFTTSNPNRADEFSQYHQGESPMSRDVLLSHQESMGILRSPGLDSEDLENTDDCTDNLSIFQNQCQEAQEPLDFENNGLIWFPPPPEDEEDDVEDSFFGYDDEDDNVGEMGMIFSSSSFSSEPFPSKERSNEEQKAPLRAVVHGHFRALVLQLLKGEGICTGNEDVGRNWLDIVASLAWQAANFVKPDTSRGGSMDPGDYVKVKCVASGSPSESTLIKGVVCTKNIKHKRMTSQYRNPKLLLLGGSLEYQRVPNMLASFDTLLQQEIEHLKMTVAKIEAHRPNVLLVEKSVSSYAQQYLLEKEISLVLNVKRALLERIARCTGATIVPSIDKLASARLGHCESFRLERVCEECDSAEQPNKKSTKTLMFFKGCPRRLGCTVLLRGTCRKELKKVKHVIQYAIFAAYHLSLETSFLADEGASLPKIAIKSPIKTSGRLMDADGALSMIPNQVTPTICQEIEHDRLGMSNKLGKFYSVSYISTQDEGNLLTGSGPKIWGSSTKHYDHPGPESSIFSAFVESDPRLLNSAQATEDTVSYGELKLHPSPSHANVGAHYELEMLENPVEEGPTGKYRKLAGAHEQTETYKFDDNEVSSEYFSTVDNHQSILVSLSSRCVLKETVCERSQLFRIKFYGSFDKPLGRFLRDDLFDKTSCCRSCNEPAEAHVRCYTHQQGSLTISVKRLSSLKLSGERDGKIWMWHRCLRCPHKDGIPPATRRVIMSDAAWGLSFGKFLELSFSNHATANRVATCGHSLQRDCLRYYGFGSMVAFFRYSPIEILSVDLPPSMLEFNSQSQQARIKSEAMEVSKKMELLYAEVSGVIQGIEQRIACFGCELSRAADFQNHITDLKDMLMKERIEYDALLEPATMGNLQPGLPAAVNILLLNRLRYCLLLDSYVWDRRLHLLDSCLKTRGPISGCDPSLPLNAILAKLKDWRSESFHKDGRLGCSSEESSVKSLTSVDNPGDFIMLKQQEDLNIRSLDASSNEIVKKELSLMSAEAYISQEGIESSSDYLTKHNEGCLDTEDPVGETTLENLPSPGSSLSDKIDFAWTGTGQPVKAQFPQGPQFDGQEGDAVGLINQLDNVARRKLMSPVRVYSFDSALRVRDKMRRGSLLASSLHLSAARSFHATGDFTSMIRDPIPNMLRTRCRASPMAIQKLNFIYGHIPTFISSTPRMVSETVRLLLPQMGRNNIVIAIYDDEPTSIISYALSSKEYEDFIADKLDEQGWNESEGSRVDDPSISVGYPVAIPSLSVFQSCSSTDCDDVQSRSYGSDDLSSSKGSLFSDAKKSHHVRVSFSDESSPAGKVKFSVTCYFAKQFDALRKKCCPSEMDLLCSLSRCRRWSAQGGKSNVYFAKTLDERFIIKQVTKTELDSFEEFAPKYFKYLMDSISSGSPTCLAKILGIYQVTVKYLKGGKDIKMDLMVMENLFYGRSISRVYDLKGSVRARYNPDTTGSNKVLLDLNLLEALRTKPLFLGSKAKRSLERAIWNDTSFLASVYVMDYSLLVGVDEGRKELVLGIIDFMRQYTWDKHLETWVKAAGILGGKNESPTVISPDQYKKRFRKAMTTYFLTVPDQWSS